MAICLVYHIHTTVSVFCFLLLGQKKTIIFNSLMITILILLSHDIFLTYSITKRISRLSHDIFLTCHMTSFSLSDDIILTCHMTSFSLSDDIILTCHMTSFSLTVSQDVFLACHMTYFSLVT